MKDIIAHRLADELGDGVGDLDREHADLLSLAHQATRLGSGDDPRRAWPVLVELLCSAEAHWDREEEMLRRHGYPDVEAHARGHCQVREGLTALLSGGGGAGDANTAEDIVVRMMIEDHRWKWWFLDAGIRPTAKA